ncbi:hypothetical protein PRUPE_1G088700 [Prunus persica]|uniref:NAC domain-containing protein n=1 Tax=Prunus persica TaxID=3760 RepID=A0A251QUH2_PRUPE|nr:NAC transcription factor 29 [Prunus persica]ONI27464.1 hypothetical protein PRUPE_1G088700 [Prunus persica]
MEKQSISSKASIVTKNGSDLHGGHTGSYDSYYDDASYFDSIPPGYRFKPLDGELVAIYLRKKIANEPLPPNKIHDVELYRFNPDTLSEIYESYGEDEMYFFTSRDKKYPNGARPNRAAGDGYWKATGVKKIVKFEDVEVGSKTSLVFYRGKPPHGDKTDWKMHEFQVNAPPKRKDRNDMRLDDCVLCRIYNKHNHSKDSNQSNNNGVEIQEQHNVGSNSQDNAHVSGEVVDHPPANSHELTSLLSNQKCYYNTDQSENLNSANCIGFDGPFGVVSISSALPFQNPQQFNGYQKRQRFCDLPSEFYTNYDQWLNDTAKDLTH